MTRFEQVVGQLREVELWENDKLWAEVAESLPNYRLSKFQALMPPWVEREVVASYLLDVAGAWRWLTGADGGLERVPAGVRTLTRSDLARVPEVEVGAEGPPIARDESRPIRWVRSVEEVESAVEALRREAMVGLDVETTLGLRTLCLAQIAGAEATWLIDALEVPDLEPLGALLGDKETVKLVQNAR